MLRVALAGAGRFGMELGRVIRELPGIDLVAVYSQTQTSAIAAGNEFGVPASASFDEILSTDGVEAVVIATSHDSHRALTIEAARAGKHVFCEKPMAVTVADCEAMIRAARDARVRLFVGHSLRYHPLVVQAKALVDSGELGRPVAVAMLRFATNIRLGWWANQARYGGMLHSPGVHELDLMNSLLGEARLVYAQAGPRIQPQIDYDDTMIVQVGYASGAIGVLATSISDPGSREVVRVLCESGSLSIELGETPALEVARPNEPVRRTIDESDVWQSIRAELGDFADWVAGRSEPGIQPADALAAVELCEAAYRSVETGLPVMLPLRAADRAQSTIAIENRAAP